MRRHNKETLFMNGEKSGIPKSGVHYNEWVLIFKDQRHYLIHAPVLQAISDLYSVPKKVCTFQC